MADSLKTKAVNGVFWVLLEKIGVQGVHFVVTLVLSRLLTPGDYGTVALLTIFVTIAGVLTESGFGRALIQRKNVTELDFNSVFYLSVFLSLICYCVLFVVAPVIASFYKRPELAGILRVVSITLVFGAFNSIQIAELNRKMLFRLSFRISLIAATSAAIVGISLAFMKFGPWALVWSTVTAEFSGMLARWFIIAWRPRLMFSWCALKPLYSYGWKMSVSSLLDTGFNNLYGLVIGKMYSSSDLAFVDRGRMLPGLLMGNVNDTLSRVAFPTLSQIQDEKGRMRETMRRMMIVSTFLVFPLMTLMAITAERVVLLLYGPAWLSAAPYVRVFCFSFALWPFHTINLQCIQAMGRSDVFLKLEIIKKVLALTALIVFLPRGVMPYMMATAFVMGPLSVLINSWPNRRLLGYTVFMQIADVRSSAMLCVAFAAVSYSVGLLFQCDSIFALVACIAAQAFAGVLVYVAMGYMFHVRPLQELIDIIGPRLGAYSSLADRTLKRWRNV